MQIFLSSLVVRETKKAKLFVGSREDSGTFSQWPLAKWTLTQNRVLFLESFDEIGCFVCLLGFNKILMFKKKTKMRAIRAEPLI